MFGNAKKLQKLDEREEDKRVSLLDELTYKNQERKNIKYKKTLEYSLISYFSLFILIYTYIIFTDLKIVNSREYKDWLDYAVELLPFLYKTFSDYIDFIIATLTIPHRTIEMYLVESIMVYTSFIVPILIMFYTYNHLIKIIKKYEILIIGGITSWDIVSQNSKEILFELKKGQKLDERELLDGTEAIARTFNKARAIVVKVNNKRSKMVFKDNLGRVEDELKMLKAEEVLEKNSLYLGVENNNKNSLKKTYTVETEWRGKFEQHGLIVGGSGSGKSFFFTSFMNNWLGTEESYKDIEKVFIVNFKNSPDFDPFLKYDKVRVADGNVKNALQVFKQVELEMLKRNTYLKQKGINDGRDLQKLIFIIDEAQTIQEMQSAKGLSKIEQNSWAEIDRILNTLASKIRSVNGSLFCILQKGTSESINTTVRANLRHRFGLKNDNMNFLLDAELIERESLNPDHLESGQMYYYDSQKNYLKSLFCLTIKEDESIKTIESDSKKDKQIVADLNETEEVALIAQKLVFLENEDLENEDRKTYFDTNEQLKEYEERDYIEEAIKLYKDGKTYKDIGKDTEKTEPKAIKKDEFNVDVILEAEAKKEEAKEPEISPEELSYKKAIEIEEAEEKENKKRFDELLDKDNVEPFNEAELLRTTLIKAKDQNIEIPDSILKDMGITAEDIENIEAKAEEESEAEKEEKIVIEEDTEENLELLKDFESKRRKFD